MNFMRPNTIKSPADLVNKGQHLAALVFESHTAHHEGDERSRTHPGHGYPAYSETIDSIKYIVFGNKEEMEAWVTERETENRYDKTKYALISAMPLKATIQTKVDIS